LISEEVVAFLLSILMVRSKKAVKSESSRAVCSSTDDETNEDSASEICDVKPSKSTGKLNKKTKPHSIGGSKSKRDNRRTKLSISDSDDNSSDSGSSDLSPILKKRKQNNSNKKDVESKKKKKKLKLYLSDDSEENMSSNLNSNDESDELQNDKKLLAIKNVKQNRVNKADVGLNDETAELSSDSSSLLQNDDDDESANKQISETEETERKQMSDEKSASNDSSLSDQNDTSNGKQAESEIEKFKKQEDLKNQRDEESDSGSSLPSLNSDSSGDRNKRNKKSDEKKSKMKPSESVDELSVLRRCIRVAGLYPNYKSLFVDCNSDREKVDAIKAYFRENGFKGRRITVEACKRFKIRKEEEKEIASLDIKNITASRLRQRKDPNMLFQPSSSAGQSSFQQTPNWKECIKHSDLFTENE
ncbi:HIRA-interacting protein 3, partial [Trichinella sp. T9]